jgi:pimeloyl-ACP methyl ester carboxylesterase
MAAWLAALLGVHAPELVNRLVLLCPAATFTRLTTEFMVRVLTSGLLRSEFLVGRTMQWLSSTPDAPSDPVFGLVAANMLTCRTLRRELQPPTKLTDDELRGISAQTLIRDVHTRLLPGAGHALMVDAPEAVVTEMTEALT